MRTILRAALAAAVLTLAIPLVANADEPWDPATCWDPANFDPVTGACELAPGWEEQPGEIIYEPDAEHQPIDDYCVDDCPGGLAASELTVATAAPVDEPRAGASSIDRTDEPATLPDTALAP
jgi:hypothetical protein